MNEVSSDQDEIVTDTDQLVNEALCRVPGIPFVAEMEVEPTLLDAMLVERLWLWLPTMEQEVVLPPIFC